MWPSADTGELRSVGAAWRTCGQSIQAAGSYATSAAASLGIEQSPEIALATKSLNALNDHCNDIGSAMIDLGNACDDYAQMVDDMHEQAHDELVSFLEWTAGIEIVGGIISIFTVGAAEAPTQAVEGAEVANAASKILNLIKSLWTAVKGIETVSLILERIKTPVQALARLLKGEEEVASIEKAAVEVEEEIAASSKWANEATLEDHSARHGADFGATSAEDYARQASSFLDRAKAEGLPTKVAPDGTIRVYDPATNTFGSYTKDGLTKTYFKPTSPTYWDRQPGELQ